MSQRSPYTAKGEHVKFSYMHNTRCVDRSAARVGQMHPQVPGKKQQSCTEYFIIKGSVSLSFPTYGDFWDTLYIACFVLKWYFPLTWTHRKHELEITNSLNVTVMIKFISIREYLLTQIYLYARWTTPECYVCSIVNVVRKNTLSHNSHFQNEQSCAWFFFF